MIEMSRTERIARAMFDKRWEDDTGKTIYDPCIVTGKQIGRAHV